MQILVLEHLIKQTKENHQLSKTTVKRIYQEFNTLAEQRQLGDYALLQYLKNENGKKLQGSDNGKIFKHRLTAGDRILYTFGAYLPYVRPEDKDSLVLIAYAKHDNQDDYSSIPKEQRYQDIDEIVGIKNVLSDDDYSEFDIDDMEAFISLVLENYSNKHTIYVIDPENLSEEDEESEEWALYLSDEQDAILQEFIRDVKPTLIMGGAGTGKTVLAVHLLNEVAEHQNNACVYFTQSRELLNKVKSQYRLVAGNNDSTNVFFYDINEACIDLLKENDIEIKRSDFVRTSEFLHFASNEQFNMLLSQTSLSKIDVWTEIRGVIKGSLGEGWKRTAPLSMYDFPGKIVQELDKKHFIERLENDKQRFVLADEPTSTELSQESYNALRTIREYFKTTDWAIEEMPIDEYLQLPEEKTMVEKDQRKVVYKLYNQYKQWLKNNSYYDENDLVRRIMLQSIDRPQFDYIIVDEVQDYTELQIYMIYSFSKNRKGIIYAGDSHQIINPTVFNERRFFTLHKDLEKRYLEKNFRCQREIVKLGNALSLVRRKKIAAGKRETAEISTRPGQPVLRLRANTKNLREILSELIKYPNVAILVADENTKEKLITLVGKDRYKTANNNVIFCISEIKGMEYKYVFGYDLISCFHDTWETILKNNNIKRTRYRYYFNLFYVAITRAQTYLCLMESADCNLLNKLQVEAPEPFIYNFIDDYDSRALFITSLTNTDEDWMKAADSFFAAGKYEEALQNFINAGASIDRINSCKAEIAVENKDFMAAIRIFLLQHNKERVKQYMDELDNESTLYFLASIMLDPRSIYNIKGFTGKKLIDIIEEYYTAEDAKNIFEQLIFDINDTIGYELQAMRELQNGSK